MANDQPDERGESSAVLTPFEAWGRLKHAAERDAANLAIHAVLEDDLARVLEVAQAAALGVGEYQPPALHDGVGSVLAPDFVGAVAMEHQFRALASL